MFPCADTECNDEDNVSEYQEEVTPFISNQRAAISNAVKSKPIPVSELWSYVAAKKLANDGGLKAEYLVSHWHVIQMVFVLCA